MYVVSLHNVLAYVLHESLVFAVSLLKYFCEVNEVFSMQGGANVSYLVRIVVAYFVRFGGYVVYYMLLGGVAFDPGEPN